MNGAHLLFYLAAFAAIWLQHKRAVSRGVDHAED